jgi:hypothetical protein
MSREYRITWGGLAGETTEELFDDAAEAIIRIAHLETQKVPKLSAEARPVGTWAPATFRTITTSHERASAALMARGRTAKQRDFIRASMTGPATEETVTFEVDPEARIVKLLYPELAAE